MNTRNLGIKTLLSAVFFTAAVTAPSTTLAQSNVQSKKAAGPTLCFLAVRGAARYNGPCGLSFKTDGNRVWYSIDMLNFGTTFARQGEGLYANEINGGSFKAIPVDRGNSLIINWNYNNLVISRDCSSAGCKFPTPGVPGRSVSATLDSFFGTAAQK
jgi:hypothetical protein